MGGPPRQRPFLYRFRHRRSDIEIEFLAESNGRDEFGVDVLRELVAHLLRTQSVHPEVVGSGNRPSAGGVIAGHSDHTGADRSCGGRPRGVRCRHVGHDWLEGGKNLMRSKKRPIYKSTQQFPFQQCIKKQTAMESVLIWRSFRRRACALPPTQKLPPGQTPDGPDGDSCS